MAESGTESPAQWRSVASSVRGSGHEYRDQCCQDAAAITVTNGGVLIAAVADGAGSARRSEEGSQIAVKAVMTFLDHALGSPTLTTPEMEEAMTAAFGIAWEALAKYAEDQQEPIKSFHTTLVCVAAKDDRLVVGHVGDSVAVIQDLDGTLETIAPPEHGEYANSTFFVTQLPELPKKLHVRALTRGQQAIALSTDGLLDIAFHEPYGRCEPWSPFFTPLFQRVRSEPPEANLEKKLMSFLGSSKIRSQTSDDVTLVLAVRVNELDRAEGLNNPVGNDIDANIAPEPEDPSGDGLTTSSEDVHPTQ